MSGEIIPKLEYVTIKRSEYDYLRAVVEGGERGQPIDPWKPDPDDPFWMLEVRQGFDEAGSWLKNDQTYLTTREPTKALRYPSRFAADCARSRLPLSESARFEPTDHLWIRPLPEPPRGDNG